MSLGYTPLNTTVAGVDVDAALAAVLVVMGCLLVYATLLYPWTLRGILAGHGALVAFAFAWDVSNAIEEGRADG